MPWGINRLWNTAVLASPKSVTSFINAPVASDPIHESKVGWLQTLRLRDRKVEKGCRGCGINDLHEERNPREHFWGHPEADQDLNE